MYYKIITNEAILDDFINFLPDTIDDEVYYLCLFGRHKYCPEFPNTKNSGQLSRVIARNKLELKEKIVRLETRVGSYSRDGVIAPQEALAVYMSINPRSLIRANKSLFIEFTNRFVNNETNFNPITLANTEIHRAICRKFVVEFDFDDADPKDYFSLIQQILPRSCFKILKTRGGFHILVLLEEIKKQEIKSNWHQMLSGLNKCDVKGSNTLTPVPGCVQGNFTPYFWSPSNVL